MSTITKLCIEIEKLLECDQLFEDNQLERVISLCKDFFSGTESQTVSIEEFDILKDRIEQLLNKVSIDREELRQILDQAPKRNQAINAYTKQSFQE